MTAKPLHLVGVKNAGGLEEEELYQQPINTGVKNGRGTGK